MIAMKYNVVKELGKGGHGSVSLVQHNHTRKMYACKTMPKVLNPLKFPESKRNSHLDDVKREVEIMQKLKGEMRAVCIEEVVEDDENIHIIMEHCAGGDIREYMENNKMYEADVRNIIRECLHVVASCHNNDIIHNDIKPQNFLLCQENDINTIKIIDFGISLEANMDFETFTMREGTPFYMAPECLQSKTCKKSDIWSIGIMANLLLTGRFPFNDHKNPFNPSVYKIWNSILNDTATFTHASWRDKSESAKSFIAYLLEKDPAKRPTVYEALSHPWITQVDINVNKRICDMVVSNINRYQKQNIIMKTIFEDFVELLIDKHVNKMNDVGYLDKAEGETSLYNSDTAITSMNSDRISYLLHVLRERAVTGNDQFTKADFKSAMRRLDSKMQLDTIVDSMNERMDIKTIISSQIDWDALVADSNKFEAFVTEVFEELDHDKVGHVHKSEAHNAVGVLFNNKSVLCFEEFYERVHDVVREYGDERIHGGSMMQG